MSNDHFFFLDLKQNYPIYHVSFQKMYIDHEPYSVR